MNSHIKDSFIQYGLKGFLKRSIKYLLRKIGIRFDSFFYMTLNINEKEDIKQFKDTCLPQVKLLCYEDFLLGDKDNFTNSKLNIIKQRLEDDSYLPYGILENNELIYSCWISLNKFETLGGVINNNLEHDEGLLLDAYCSPKARGRGLHNSMNAYRIWQLYRKSKSKAIVVVLTENKPAYKSQIKVGFKTAFTYTVIIIWGKIFTNFSKKKQNYVNRQTSVL